MQKEETLNLVLRIPYLGIFGMSFWKIIIVFEISTLKFFKSKILTKSKMFRPKMPYLGIFKMEFEKTIIVFDPSTPEFFKILIFVQNKYKAFCGHFLAKI